MDRPRGGPRRRRRRTPERGPADLENAILTVRRTTVDDGHPERVNGEILHVDPAPRSLRAALPVLPDIGAQALRA